MDSECGGTKMVRIAVVDDRPDDRRRMARITETYFRKKRIPFEVEGFDGSAGLFRALDEKNCFDFFLLDLQMADMTGLQIAREIRNRYSEPVIIFVTNYLSYAIEAYEVNAFRYIPKELMEGKLPEAFEAMMPQIDARDRSAYIINHELRAEKIFYRDIFYVKKEGKHIVIVHRNGESRERKTLQEFYGETDPEEFFYVDKGCVVNARHIMSFRRGELSMRNQDILAVSRPRFHDVQERIIAYWEERNP